MSATAHSAPPGGIIAGPGRESALALATIGMSAGGIPALKAIVQATPRDFPGAIVVAYHVAAPSLLPELIRGWARHDCRLIEDGEPLRRSVIYVTPAQHHVVVNPDATLALSKRARVRFVRPSTDWLFESAAASFGDRALAVVLSGANADGSRGIRAIARAGGTIIVQEPTSCDFPTMPGAAIATGLVHHCLPPDRIAASLVRELARMEDQPIHDWNSFRDDAPRELSSHES